MRGLRQSCASLKTPSRKLAVVAHAHAGPKLHARHAPQIAAFVATAVITGMGFSSPAMAEKVGEFAGSGFLFKDNIEVAAIDDNDVPGVTIYISDFQRNIVDKLKKDFFSDPSQASLTCAVTGPIAVKDWSKITQEKSGVEVFSEKKSLNLFQDKTLRIRRLYDEKRRSLIYVAYSTRLSTASDDGSVTTGRYRTSICAIKLPDAPSTTLDTPGSAE